MCRESNNTHHRLAISSDIAYSVWSIVYSSAHGFFQNLGTDERTAPHFRVIIILIQQRSRTKRMKAIMTIIKDHVSEKPRLGWDLWRHGRP